MQEDGAGKEDGWARLESREESSWAWKLDAMDQVAGENVVGN